jgi:uncharacterized membrane protein
MLKFVKTTIFSVISCVMLVGCNHAPSQNILGSFFPSWMLCAAGGVFVSSVAKLVLSKAGVDEFVPAKLLVYVGLAVAVTFLLWLEWFAN